jgi:DNA-directed RNA polymerase I subunit RPA2
LEPNGSFSLHAWKTNEDGYIDQVRILETDKEGRGITYATIKIRFNRNPVIGDKFSSRHGQKVNETIHKGNAQGTLSRLWPQIDMPFSESGMTPDVIINPNAFPSRMTIGMLVESMAGKSGSLHAIYQDGSPFQFNEQNTAVKHFGDQLVKAGYNYYGNEPMYSGTTGQIFQADIYLGVMYFCVTHCLWRRLCIIRD